MFVLAGIKLTHVRSGLDVTNVTLTLPSSETAQIKCELESLVSSNISARWNPLPEGVRIYKNSIHFDSVVENLERKYTCQIGRLSAFVQLIVKGG